VLLKNETFQWDTKHTKLKIIAKVNPALYQKTIAEKKSTPSLGPKGPPPPQTGSTNRLLFGKGSFISIDQDTSAHLEEQVRPTKSEDLSALQINIETTHTHLIAQLLNRDQTVIRQTLNSKSITWEDLPPGDYKIRVIIDLNKNGKWDPGNYFLKQEPEPVVYYLNPKSTPVNTTHVKANWRVGPLLIKY
jgi:hypothetical protein